MERMEKEACKRVWRYVIIVIIAVGSSTYVRDSSGAEAARSCASDVEFVLRERARERLCVGVHDPHLDSVDGGAAPIVGGHTLDHPIHRIAPAAAHSNHLQSRYIRIRT